MPNLTPEMLTEAKPADIAKATKNIANAMKKDLAEAPKRWKDKSLSFVAALDVPLSGAKMSIFVVTPKQADVTDWLKVLKELKAPVVGRGTCELQGAGSGIRVKVLTAKMPSAQLTAVLNKVGKATALRLTPVMGDDDGPAKGVPDLLSAYMAAVKNSDGLTSALPTVTAALSKAEKAGEAATLKTALGALSKHKADAGKARGADPAKLKAFQTDIDTIAKRILAGAGR